MAKIDVEDYAEALGIDAEDLAEDLGYASLEAADEAAAETLDIGEFGEYEYADLQGGLDEYFADMWDLDIHDVYDMFFGYSDDEG